MRVEDLTRELARELARGLRLCWKTWPAGLPYCGLKRAQGGGWRERALIALLLPACLAAPVLLLWLPNGFGFGLPHASVLLVLSTIISRFLPGWAISGMERDGELEAQLQEEVTRLHERSGVNVDIHIALEKLDSDEEPNAMVCGLGAGRRLVVNRTLATEFEVKYFAAIVAHELAHLKRRHVFWSIFTLAALIGLMHGMRALMVDSALGAGLFFLGVFCLILFKFYVDRLFEYAADHLAAEWVGPTTMAAALVRLDDPESPGLSRLGRLKALFHTHPTIAKRVTRLSTAGSS